MTQGHLNERGDLNVAALAVYAILLIAVIWILIRNGLFKYIGYIYMLLLIVSMYNHT